MSNRKGNKARRADEFADQQHDGAKQDGTTTGTTCKDTTITDELRNQWASIVAEVDANREAFAAYVRDIRGRIERNNGWTGGTDFLRNFMRDGHFVKPDGNDFKCCHGHDAVWVREICRRWPDVAPHILPTLKASKFDVFYPDLFTAETEA